MDAPDSPGIGVICDVAPQEFVLFIGVVCHLYEMLVPEGRLGSERGVTESV